MNAHRRLWSDWADAQADLSFRWAHTHLVGFVMSRLKTKNKNILETRNEFPDSILLLHCRKKMEQNYTVSCLQRLAIEGKVIDVGH